MKKAHETKRLFIGARVRLTCNYRHGQEGYIYEELKQTFVGIRRFGVHVVGGLPPYPTVDCSERELELVKVEPKQKQIDWEPKEESSPK